MARESILIGLSQYCSAEPGPVVVGARKSVLQNAFLGFLTNEKNFLKALRANGEKRGFHWFGALIGSTTRVTDSAHAPRKAASF